MKYIPPSYKQSLFYQQTQINTNIFFQILSNCSIKTHPECIFIQFGKRQMKYKPMFVVNFKVSRINGPKTSKTP